MTLTPRQMEIAKCLGRGLSDKEIARELEIAVITVKHHMAAVRRRLGARNRTHAAVMIAVSDNSETQT